MDWTWESTPASYLPQVVAKSIITLFVFAYKRSRFLAFVEEKRHEENTQAQLGAQEHRLVITQNWWDAPGCSGKVWGLLKHRAKQEPTERLNPLKEGSSIHMHYIQNWREGVVQDFFPSQIWSSPKLTKQSFKAISVYKPWRLRACSNGKHIHNKSNEGVTGMISVPLEAWQFSQHRNIKLATSVHCNLMISWFINLPLGLTSINSDWNSFSAIMSGLLTHKLSWSFEDGSSCMSSTQSSKIKYKKNLLSFFLHKNLLTYCMVSDMNSTAEGRKFGLFGK